MKKRTRQRLAIVFNPTILALFAFLLAAMVAIVWQAASRIRANTTTLALREVDLDTQFLLEFRSTYTSEVVDRVRPMGITVTHNYLEIPGAIPLPVTLSMELGKKLAERHGGTHASLYSPFPFPSRGAQGGLRDTFAKDAWAALNANPKEPFYRFETLDGVPVLRYARADVMREKCVQCHNTHPDSPRRDWKVGDVRGVLQIVRPTRDIQRLSREGTRETFLLALSVLLPGVLGIAVVARRLQMHRAQLEAKATQLSIDNQEIGQRVALAEEEISLLTGEVDRARAARDQEMMLRLQTLEQLRHADRLSTVGTMAAGVAHELGTPLNVIHARAKMIANRQVDGAAVQNNANIVVQQAEHITQIIKDLLNFARRSTPVPAREDLLALAAETLRVLEPLAKKALVRCSVDSPLPVYAQIDRQSIVQVLTNLMVNAIAAMPKGGTLSVKVTHGRAQPPAGVEGLPADYARVDVIDSGTGISHEVLGHIFEPFFTTKQVGEGTGLGLAVAWGIARDHRGWIEVQSTPGEGSCFSLYLPYTS